MTNTKGEVINVFHTKRKEIARNSIVRTAVPILCSKR